MEQMKKSKVRKEQKRRLLLFAQSKQKQKEDRRLADALMASSVVRNCQSIGVTASLPLEINTKAIIRRLWQAGKAVYLAKANIGPSKEMNFVRYRPDALLRRSSLGVWEIADQAAAVNNNLDLLLVPGLAFALSNHARLGFGGGYYDRFLKKHTKLYTIALANSLMVFTRPAWPVAQSDVPVQTIITPQRIYF